MLTTEDNDLLTRVGPGTPMGALLRHYWLPFLHSVDLPKPDGAPVRVRLLGENLVAFRNTERRVGLLDHACPHRCASLFYGRNEEGGLRCIYHGWKFDVDGRCLDMANEPETCDFKHKVRALAYPVREHNGILWAYLGPRPEPPSLPELGWAQAPETRRCSLKYLRDCNWLQALEGDVDSSHLSFLHLSFERPPEGTTAQGVDYYRRLPRMSCQPFLDVRDTDVGVMYAARRETEDEACWYWRVTQFLMPVYTSVPGYDGKQRAKVWVPLDDEHTLVWETHWSTDRDLNEEERKGWKGRVPRSGFLPDSDDWLGRGRFAANRTNDYLQDRERQRAKNISGLEESAPLQDACMQESMGPIVDRTREHLGPADAALLRVRKRLLVAVRALRDQRTVPPGVDAPGLYRLHGCQMLLAREDDWAQAIHALCPGL